MARINRNKNDKPQNKKRKTDLSNKAVIEGKTNKALMITTISILGAILIGLIAFILVVVLKKEKTPRYDQYEYITTSEYDMLFNPANPNDLNDNSFNEKVRNLIRSAEKDEKAIYIFVFNSTAPKPTGVEKHYEAIADQIDKVAAYDNSKTKLILLMDLSEEGNASDFLTNSDKHLISDIDFTNNQMVLFDFTFTGDSTPLPTFTINIGDKNRILEKLDGIEKVKKD